MNVYNYLARMIRSCSERCGLENVKTHSIYTRPIHAGSIVLDLGANFGHFTEEMNRRIGCACYAIESMPDNYARIDTGDSIHKFNLAVSDEVGPLQLFRSASSQCHSVHEGLATEYGLESLAECPAGNRSRVEGDMRTTRSGGPNAIRRPGFAVE
jgi:hypothetical protein